MAEIFTPFLTAFILAYALRPVCLLLERHRLPRALAAALSMLIGLCLIFFILISLLTYEIPLIKAKLPDWIANTQAWLGPKLSDLHVNFDWNTLKTSATQKITEHINDNANSLMSSTINTVLMSGSSVIARFVNAVLIVFVMFCLLMDWSHFFGLVKSIVPVRAQETVHHLAMHTDGLLSQSFSIFARHVDCDFHHGCFLQRWIKPYWRQRCRCSGRFHRAHDCDAIHRHHLRSHACDLISTASVWSRH